MTEKQTEIVFLLDRSGSMSGLEADTIGGFNEFVKNQSELDEETKLTTILFDNEYEVLFEGVNAKGIKITEKDYFVRGMTALLDAIGKTILSVSKRLDKESKIIFVITTDGMENSSIEFTHEKIKAMIRDKQDNAKWEFIFMGANIDAAKEASHIGISEADAYQFKADAEGIRTMYSRVNEAVKDYRKE